MAENIKKQGYYTTTYKIRMYTNHVENLKKTNDIYNELVLGYYNILLKNPELLRLSNQNCLRELELLTVASKKREKTEINLGIETPAYFRRAAINQAIGQARIYQSLMENYEKGTDKKAKKPSQAIEFHCSTVFYKGMYKDLEKESIRLKLFDGNEWKWFEATLKGWNISEGDEVLSPTIVISKNYVMAHIPVKKIIDDVTPVKEKMQDKETRVCGISFSNSDSFAICVVLDIEGKMINTLFVKGGNEYKDRTSKILGKIKKHREKNWDYAKGDHKKYWTKLNQISTFYAHQVSKKIVDFCLENNAKVISIAEIQDVSIHFGKKVGKYSPIYLRKKILDYLSYKAFKEGIIITKVRSNYTASRCYICRGKIKRKGLKYICEKEGHQGDYFFNSAMNIGIMCLKKFGKETEFRN